MTREEINVILRSIQKVETKLESEGKLTHPSTWQPETDIFEQLKWVFEVDNCNTDFNWSPNGCVTKKVVI